MSDGVVGGPAKGIVTDACGTFAASEDLKHMKIRRRYPLLPKDVLVEIAYCGLCHSDIHFARNEWGFTTYPIIPGHEINGFVKEVGGDVRKFKIGQKCGVCVFVNTCKKCEECKNGTEQYCLGGTVNVFGSKDVEYEPEGSSTYGGYSKQIVVNEDFLLHWPESLPMKEGAPLLCAGITVYSPLRYTNVKKGTKVGIVGLGGLGHVAVSMAHAMGAYVCVLSRGKSADKEALAKKLGADEFIATGDAADLNQVTSKVRLDVIIDTVSADHDIIRFLNLMRPHGTYVVVGVPPEPLKIPSFALCMKRISVQGSVVGSVKETQEMLDFCAKNNIVCMTELIEMKYINEAFQRVVDADVKFRFVIDIKNSSFDKC